MKCPVCQYEFEEEFVHEHGTRFYKTITGDDSFIRIEGHFTRIKERDYAPDEREVVSLYACPKCGVIKFEE